MQKSSSNATEISIYGMETLDQSNLPDREPRPLHHIGVTNSPGHSVTISGYSMALSILSGADFEETHLLLLFEP